MAVIKTKQEELITSLDVEIAVANHFNYRANLIVPNVFWGLGFRHELDVAIMTPAGHLTEVEIKTSAADLRRDRLKQHGHYSPRIRRHFFAVPEKLKELCLEVAPAEWGILSTDGYFTETIRPAKINKASRPLSDAEIDKLYELAAMRTWTLKEALRTRINRDRLEVQR